jgi:heme a synthase
MTDSAQPPVSRWLHAWAVLTVLVTLPLLLLGAEVTTKKIGMVDSQGLRSPWYFVQEFVNHQGLAWRIEHGHRQVGWIVGLCAIVLAVWLWLGDRRWGVRWLGTVALVAVGIQGCLGIFRVQLNVYMGDYLAFIHGCFAQIVMALLVAVAFVTSPGWSVRPAHGSTNLRAWAFVTVGLVYAQLIVGGLVRHLDFPIAGRLHMLLAFAVVASVLWVTKLAFDHDVAPRAVKILLALIAVQVFLGVESWLTRFYNQYLTSNMLQPLSVHADWFRTLHYLTGTLIFATSVIIALRAQQAMASQPSRLMEEAA